MNDFALRELDSFDARDSRSFDLDMAFLTVEGQSKVVGLPELSDLRRPEAAIVSYGNCHRVPFDGTTSFSVAEVGLAPAATRGRVGSHGVRGRCGFRERTATSAAGNFVR